MGSNNEEHLHLYEVFQNCFNKIAYRRDSTRDIPPYDVLYENECDKGMPPDVLPDSHVMRGMDISMGVNPENNTEHWPIGCNVYDGNENKAQNQPIGNISAYEFGIGDDSGTGLLEWQPFIRDIQIVDRLLMSM